MDIFLTMTLPQLDVAAHGHEVRHVVSYSALLPLPYQRQLEAAARQYGWLVLDKVALGAPHVDPMSYAPAGMIGSYRLDDDDILPVDYFDRVAPYVTTPNTGMFVSLAAGLTAIYRDGALYFTRRAYVPMIALGFLAIHQKHEDGSFTSPPTAAHNLSDRAAPVIVDSRLPGYMWVRHLDQDTNVHAVHVPREQRLQTLLTNMGERPPASDRSEIARHFSVIADRIHAGAEPGEELQAAVTEPTVIPADGLALTLDPIRGHVELLAKVRPAPSAVPRNALVAFKLEDADGVPIGAERADELREAGLNHSPRTGYYKYLRTEPGRFVTRVEFTLPEGVSLTSALARKWHRLETNIRLEELSFTSRR